MTLSGMAAVAAVAASAWSGTPEDTARQTLRVTVEVEGGRLHGTMEVPSGNGPFPVVLIIAGSGPTDRDGNSALLPGRNDSLRLLAESLAGRGIASVRYDKRGVGGSASFNMTEADLRFGMYAEDAAAWIRQLQQDARFDRVVVAGHSEGALLGTLAAQSTRADGVVLLAGAGRPIAAVLREQLGRSLPPPLLAAADSIMRELEAGRTVATVPAELQALFRPSVQPYLISWLPLDPARELGRVEAPVLVVRGTTDIQAMADDAARLTAANPRARFVSIEGMNHVFKLAGGATPQEQLASYSDATLPIAPGLVNAVAEFVKAVPAQRRPGAVK